MVNPFIKTSKCLQARKNNQKKRRKYHQFILELEKEKITERVQQLKIKKENLISKNNIE